jgi:hypothetical protein
MATRYEWTVKLHPDAENELEELPDHSGGAPSKNWIQCAVANSLPMRFPSEATGIMNA